MPKSSNSCKSGSKSRSGKGNRSMQEQKTVFSSIAPPTDEESRALAACMPPLGGRQLPPPSFYRTGWQANQTFTCEDDPDRTLLPWVTPQFVRHTDPASRAIQVEELFSGNRGASFARVARHVLGQEDCAALISSVNAKGFTPALLNIGSGMQRLVPGARDGHRVIVDSPELAAWLFQVLLPCLPPVLEDGSRLVELNERCRFLCYTPGQQFPAHCDGTFERPEDHPHSGDFSYVTVQLYLHDIPTSFGGATAFMLPGKPKHQPEAGSVLFFSQDLMHEGCLVENGVKYALRTEAMYAPPGSRVAVAV